MPKKKTEPKLPAYQEPFNQQDFRGYFRWTDLLSERLGGSLYHACHEDELDEILDAGLLLLRSTWQLRLPEQGMWPVPGVWCGLNDFNVKGNYYGPCLMRFPISVLGGRHFMVFRREDVDRNRYFFVQHESGIPIYRFDGQAWRWVKPDAYFDKTRNRLSRKKKAIYDVVLTAPLPLVEYTVTSVQHPRCISGKCGCCDESESERIVRRVGLKHAKRLMAQSQTLQSLLDHLPCLEGRKVTLERADD